LDEEDKSLKKLKILLLIKPFGEKYPKHKAKYDMIKAIEEVAEVRYWSKDGHIRDILKKLAFQPDFIFHYEMAWGIFAPKITGLDKIPIPTGCYMIDTHYYPDKRRQYFRQTKIDLIFCPVKSAFYRVLPDYRHKHRWLPFSIDPKVFKDWGQRKDIDFLLLGQVHYKSIAGEKVARAGKYAFRDAVLQKMQSEKGFVFQPHPGHLAPPSPTLLANERYAQLINRSKMFFTCGGMFQYPVMKFFEAPACRSLLLAEPPPDILELGFKDGENFVACDRSNFYEKALYYLNNEDERERITRNGYEFVHKYHSNRARAEQFVAYVEEFLQTWKGKTFPQAARRRTPRANRKNISLLLSQRRRPVRSKRLSRRKGLVRRIRPVRKTRAVRRARLTRRKR
jgi:spore maturation protein CgeB